MSEKRCWNNVARKQTRLRPSQLKPFLAAVNEMRDEAMVYRQDFTATVCDFVEFMAFTGLRKTELLGPVDLCCTYFTQQYIGSHIIENASDTILA